MTMRVGDIMRQPITVSPRATVIEAARLMREKNIGWLIVSTGQQPIGIVTERDLLYKVMAAGLFTESTNVMQVMTSKLVVGTPKMTVQEAVAVMHKHTIRRLPIVDHDKLVGVVTSRDIFAELDKHPAEPAKSVPKKKAPGRNRAAPRRR
ncbi:MAG: CBS domain-containing protein [Halobacteria archaeon]